MKKILFIIELILFISPFSFFAQDLLAADNKAAEYRTGKIDSYVKTVPPLILQNAIKLPEVNLKPLVQYLMKETNNDFQRVKRVHDWITIHIAYDFDLFQGKSEQGSRKVNDLLPIKRTVCSGFSRLFAAMLKIAGLEVIVIPGYSNSYLEKDGTPGDHVWNAVKIQGKWYIVDTTHDQRIAYEDGKFSELGEYRDTELFIHPQSKILVNLPENPDYQFLDSPISLEDFLKAPIRKTAFNKYGLVFPKQSFLKQLQIDSEFRPGGKVQSRFNIVKTKAQAVTLFLDFPDFAAAKAYLYDENDQLIPFRSFCFRENNRVQFQFSSPAKGRFKAIIRARDMRTQDLWFRVYEFYIDELQKAGPLVPLNPGIYTRDQARYLGVELLEDNFKNTASNGLFKIKIEHPEAIEVAAVFKNHLLETLNQAEAASILGNQRTYFFRAPAKGNYLVQILARKTGDEYYFPAYETAIFNQSGPGPDFPPKNELMISNAFNKNNHQLIKKPEKLNNNTIHFVVKPGPGYYLKILTRDNKKQNIYGYHCFTIEDSQYHFYLSPPHAGYTSYVFQVDKENQWWSILSYTFDENALKGPYLPEQGKIYLGNKKDLLISAEINQGKNNIASKVILKDNNEMEFWGAIYDLKGNRNYDDFIIVSYEKNQRIYYLGDPGPDYYQAIIYAKKKGDKQYTKTVCAIGLNSLKPEKVSIPPRGELIFTKRMKEHDFELQYSDVSSKAEQKSFKIRMKAPPDFTMACRLKDPDNQNVKNHYFMTKTDNIYEFMFTSPGKGNYTARIYQIDTQDTWNTLIYFILP